MIIKDHIEVQMGTGKDKNCKDVILKIHDIFVLIEMTTHLSKSFKNEVGTYK